LTSRPEFNGLLIISHLRVQNTNAISSSLTWGFPAITAFLGLMWALERRIADDCELHFQAVGVICHAFTPLVTRSGYHWTFCLTRNPVERSGSTQPIVEEGRAHMEISLIFGVNLPEERRTEEQMNFQAKCIQNILEGMRVAGGSVLPTNHGLPPRLVLLDETSAERAVQFRQLCRISRLFPGSALVARPDLLSQRRQELAEAGKDGSLIETWLDLNRLNWRAKRADAEESEPQIVWEITRPKKSWVVPIPVGYAALTPAYDGGKAKQTRDRTTPFRFVESLYSFGEWINVHRLKNAGDLLWYGHYDEPAGLYLARNDYSPQQLEI